MTERASAIVGALPTGNWILRESGRVGVKGQGGGKTEAAPSAPYTEKALREG